MVEQLIWQHVVGGKTKRSILTQAIPEPSGGHHLQFEGYWVPRGTQEPLSPAGYVLTASVRANLRDLVRIVSAG